MNKLILCEGKSDVILLSYYLDKMCGWTVSRKPPKNVNIQVEPKRNEYGCWYTRNSDYLFICGVGGKDNFEYFFHQKILPPMIDSASFSKIAVVTDRDDRNIEDIASDLNTWMTPIEFATTHNVWSPAVYTDSFGMQQDMQVLLLVIPTEHEGALESVLLDAISEDPYDKEIVARSGAFVNEIAPIAERYLHQRRLKLKAHLAVTWAIQSPEKEFHFIDEQIRGIPWENSEVLRSCFSQLLEI